jgi:hypothetical protein
MDSSTVIVVAVTGANLVISLGAVWGNYKLTEKTLGTLIAPVRETLPLHHDDHQSYYNDRYLNNGRHDTNDLSGELTGMQR